MANKKFKKRFYNYIAGIFLLFGIAVCLNAFALNSEELKIAHVTDVHFSQELDNTPYK